MSPVQSVTDVPVHSSLRKAWLPLLCAERRKMLCSSGGRCGRERPAEEPGQIAGNGTGTLRRAGGLSANWWTSQRWKESNEYREAGMWRLLKIALVVGLSAIPSYAQRAMSFGHSGGFSGPRGFAPAPHMSGGFNRGGLTPGVRSGFVGTPTQRGFNPSPTYRKNTLIPSGGVSRPRSFGNWHGSPSQTGVIPMEAATAGLTRPTFMLIRPI
jgi:hypothetical protein